jgi:hypothetical protein
MIVPERMMRTGKVCPAFQIDDDLAGEVMKYKWTISDRGYLRGRAAGMQSVIQLHQFVYALRHGASPKCGLQIDHKNRNKLDNRTDNLRCVTALENIANSNGRTGVPSASRKEKLPIGVTRYGPGRKYFQARFKGAYLGCFRTAEEASAAYQSALSNLKGNA